MKIKPTVFFPEFDAGILTQDTMLQIFLSSSSHALAIFRAVSKTWDTFISHENFKKLYWKTLVGKKDVDFLVVGGVLNKMEKLLMMIKNPTEVFEIRMFDFPVCATGMMVVGSCNGFICLSDSRLAIKRVDRIVVWNPITTEVRALRLPPPKETESPSSSMGIAYNSNRYDYTIVRIVLLSNFPLQSLVQTYSLLEDSWKDSVMIPFHTNDSASIFNIDGVPFWSGCEGGTVNKVISSFDPFHNVFKKFDYPPGVESTMVHPVNLQDRVCALVLCEDCHVDMFSLDELTSKWVKKFSTGRLDLHYNIYSTRKLQCFKDIGDIVVFGYWHTHIAFHECPGSSFVPQLGREIVGFQPHWTGPFAYTVTNVKVPGGRKVFNAQPQPEGGAWNVTRRSRTKELADQPKSEVKPVFVVDVVEGRNKHELGSYPEIALSPLTRLFCENKEVSEIALEELVIFSQKSYLAANMVQMGMVKKAMEMLSNADVVFTKLLVNLLVNLTRLDVGVDSLLKSGDEMIYGMYIMRLVTLFTSGTSNDEIKGDAFDHVGSVLVNVSNNESGRKLLLDPKTGLLKQLLKQFDSTSPLRKKAVSGIIHNCCLEAENHLESLLSTAEFLWPALLLPVAGKQVYREEETFKMPIKLGSALLIEREPVDDPNTRIETLQSLYVIAMQERGRKALRLVNCQLILEVGAACEEHPEVMELYERVSSLLLQDSHIEEPSTQEPNTNREPSTQEPLGIE